MLSVTITICIFILIMQIVIVTIVKTRRCFAYIELKLIKSH